MSIVSSSAVNISEKGKHVSWGKLVTTLCHLPIVAEEIVRLDRLQRRLRSEFGGYMYRRVSWHAARSSGILANLSSGGRW